VATWRQSSLGATSLAMHRRMPSRTPARTTPQTARQVQDNPGPTLATPAPTRPSFGEDKDDDSGDDTGLAGELASGAAAAALAQEEQGEQEEQEEQENGGEAEDGSAQPRSSQTTRTATTTAAKSVKKPLQSVSALPAGSPMELTEEEKDRVGEPFRPLKKTKGGADPYISVERNQFRVRMLAPAPRTPHSSSIAFPLSQDWSAAEVKAGNMSFKDARVWCSCVGGVPVPNAGKIRRFINFCDNYHGMSTSVMDKTLKWMQRDLQLSAAKVSGHGVATGAGS
jgi:hypothetical protein